MARFARVAAWAAVALAVPATVAFSPVHPADAPRWAPQLVAAVQPVRTAAPAALAAVPRPASAAGPIAVRAALTRLGDPYVWAAAGPHAFDCSGLTKYAWGKAGVYLPHQSAAQYASTPHVPKDQAQPGDLIFYYSPIGHVAMYLGGGMLIHAPATGDVVKISPVNWSKVCLLYTSPSPRDRG